MSSAVVYLKTKSAYLSTMAKQGCLVVIDFGATWCGPCRRFEPHFAALAQQHPDVAFGKVTQDKDEGGKICQDAFIRSFPTIRFYVNGAQVDEMSGADIETCTAKVEMHKTGISHLFEGAGYSMASGSGPTVNASPAAAREARLKRFGGTSAAAEAMPPAVAMDDDGNQGAVADAELQAALAMSMDVDETAAGGREEASSSNDPNQAVAPTAASISAAEAAADEAEDAADEAELADLTASGQGSMMLPPVNDALLAEVVAMGFPEVRVRKALIAGCGNADAVVTWALEHGEDAGIDDPVPLVPSGGGGASGVQKSWKCEETGRLFRSMEEVQMYAEKTGRTNFSESTEEKKPLTAEEKAAKIEAIKAKLASRRAEREVSEKVDEVEQEKQRRTMGKEMAATREQMEKEKRLREYALMKKEKQAQKLERERLRAEIAKDKAERKARGGKLNSVLGKDGYNPSGMSAQISADIEGGAADSGADAGAGVASSSSSAKPAAAPVVTNEEAVDQAIETISRYKVGGDGGKALKLLGLYVKNIVEKPDEAKYRSINMESNAFKTKVAPLKGGVALLRAIGFEKNATSLDLSLQSRDVPLLSRTQAKLDAGLAKYLG